MRPAPAFALVVLLTSTATAQDTTLKYVLKEGDVFYAKNVSDQDMKMEVMGNKIPIKMKVTMVQKFAVKSVKPGEATVEMTITDMGIDAGALAGVGAVADKLKGVTLTATLDDQFKVTKVAGQDKLLEKLAGDDPNVKAMVKGMAGAATVEQWFAVAFPPLPAKAVAPGGTWTRDAKMPMAGLGEVEVKKKLTLQGVSGGLATVKETADVTFKADAGGGALPFKITKSDLKSTDYAATHVIDVATGRLKESKTKMAMTGSMTMSAQGQEIQVTMDAKTTATVTISDKNPVTD